MFELQNIELYRTGFKPHTNPIPKYRLIRNVRHLTGKEFDPEDTKTCMIERLIAALRSQLATEMDWGRKRHPYFERNRLIVIAQTINALESNMNSNKNADGNRPSAF